jgi:MFS family permease
MKFSTKTRSLAYSMEFIHGIRRALMVALALVYFISFGFNIVSITTLFAIAGVIRILLEFPTGAIADYDSRKKSLMISFFLMFLGFLGLFLFSNYWLLAASWIIGEIAWTFSSGAGGAWAIDALELAKKKSKLVKFISKGYIFEKSGHIIGGLIGFFIVAINFRYIWLFVSLSNLFMFFVLWIYLEEKNFKPEKVPHNYIRKAWIKAGESFSYLLHQKNKELRMLFLGGFLGVVAMGLFFVAMPLFITETLGLNPEYIPMIFSVIAVLTLFAPFLAEKIANKRGFRVSLFIVWVIICAAMFLFALPKMLIFAIIALAIILFSETINDIIEESAEHHEFSSKIRASLGSLSSINWGIANSVSVFLAGISITTFGVVPTIIISGIFSLITGIVFLVGLKK